MAKRAGLPWDCILSAEVFRAYKPHPDTYLVEASISDVSPGQVMMVAAHHSDFEAAQACGLKTAYIERRWNTANSRFRTCHRGREMIYMRVVLLS